ncbi:hypothetical protein U9M48_009422, partial [Paspalum notatum var. saurae]
FCPRLASALVGTEPARTKSSSFPHTRNPRSRRSPASRRAAAARARAHASAPGPAIACPCPRESQARPRQTLPPLTPRFSARPTATPDPARLRPDCDIRPRASGPRRPLVEADSSSTVEASTSQAGEAAEEGMVTPGQSPDTSWLPAGLRAYCSRKKEEGCRWRLHDSIMKDNTTIKVKKNPHQHKCTSARRSKNVKNATKFWICEQVKDWLMEDSRVGPKELQWRIKDKYKVQLPYKRVFDAGRRHNERFKGCMEAGGSTTKRKGSHQCPICKNYGHRWYNCKNGDPDDIAAMLAERGPPKKKKKKSEPSCESAILPVDSVPKAMHFPPSQRASISMDSNSLRSTHGSNQPELLSIEYPVLSLGQTTPPSATSIPTKEKKKATGKGKGKAAGKGKGKAKEQGKKKKKIPVLPDSPAMSTRSKTPQRQSPAAHTRRKRKLPDLNL